METLLKDVPRKDTLVVQGDWNAKIGMDACKQWKGYAGKFGVGTTNERGNRLLQFAKAYKLVVANTLFNHKNSRKTTWHAPDGSTHSQIDFILVSKRFQSAINKARTRTFTGPDIGSDHDLVMMTLKIKLAKHKDKDTNRVHFDLEKLKDPCIKREFQHELSNRFSRFYFLNMKTPNNYATNSQKS